MTEQNWKPLFRTPMTSVTRVLRSPAFLQARERSAVIVETPAELRALAERVESLDYVNAPLSAVADRVFAAVRFLRATEARLEEAGTPASPAATSPAEAQRSSGPSASGAGSAARERLLVASLDYLVTPDDLVPDFRAGGYIDDVLLLPWVFGVAVNELAPYLDDDVDP